MKLLLVFTFLWVLGLHIEFAQSVKTISIEDVTLRPTFSPKSIRGIRSMNDGEFYTVLKSNCILKYSYKTGLITDTLFAPYFCSDTKLTDISDYQFSNDESVILIETNAKAIYRHSYTANYFVYNRTVKKLSMVSKNGDQQLATLSPDNKHVAFVRENNLFVSDFSSETEQTITTDGKHNFVINGAPDWVYEEEFGFSKGFEWSPSGTEIAFMRFDESQVPMFSMVKYGEDLYPSVVTFKYPKAGEANSIVSIWVYNLATQSTTKMDVGTETDQYIPRIKWTATPNILSIIRLNRLQNKVDILLADATSGKSNLLYTETNKYFISEVNDNFVTYTTDKTSFIVVSERSGYQQLYRYSMEGKLLNAVTTGNFDVTEILGVDQNAKKIYYRSTETSPLNRDVYVVGFDGKGKKMLSPGGGTSNAEFSTTYKYFILNYSNASTPVTYTLYNNQSKVIRVLEDNAGLVSQISNYGFTKKEFIKVPVAEGLELNGFIIKPKNFDPTQKYPLFMFVYGGPQAQDVVNSWDRSMPWYQLLTQKGYIVACVDNRGTDGRGEAFKKSTYMQLGKLELEDQVNAAKYFGSLTYIDKSRIGIFGWSYGGYMTSLCMTKGNGTFRMGIAVAPVTNWRFYDNIYTERFMRTPQENPKGYDDNSPINFAEKLQGNFLLVHGSADDNVHLQNTMIFSEKLVQAGVKFDEAIYTDKNHGIYGGKTRYHLYSKMTDFILKNL